MKHSISRFVWDDQGQDLTEYAMLMALVAVAAILAFTFLAGRFKVSLDGIAVAVGSIGAAS